jgi:hypothetical protein
MEMPAKARTSRAAIPHLAVCGEAMRNGSLAIGPKRDFNALCRFMQQDFNP